MASVTHYTVYGYEFILDYGGAGFGITIDPAKVSLDDPAWRAAYDVAAAFYVRWRFFMDRAYEGHQIDPRSMLDADLEQVRITGLEMLDNGTEWGYEADSWELRQITEYVSAVTAEQERRAKKAMLPPRPSRVTKPTPGYVYLIKSPTGAFKIGRTKNPADRLKTFSVKLPFEVEYVCLIPTSDMHGLEADLHGRFTSKHVNGEWFALDATDVDAIKALAVQS
jgi:hypothetical protein